MHNTLDFVTLRSSSPMIHSKGDSHRLVHNTLDFVTLRSSSPMIPHDSQQGGQPPAGAQHPGFRYPAILFSWEHRLDVI
jgi:hypothetical protein